MANHQFEQHPDIQKYFNMEEPDKEIIARAYATRNIELGIEFNEMFKYATDKLCLNPKSIKSLIDGLFKKDVKKKVEDYINSEEKRELELKINYKKYYEQKIDTKEYQDMIVKYNKLLKYNYIEDHYGFYMALTIDDLYDLGF